jgi:hypothetical protein
VAKVSESMSSDAMPYTCAAAMRCALLYQGNGSVVHACRHQWMAVARMHACMHMHMQPDEVGELTRPSLHICAHCASASDGACGHHPCCEEGATQS